MKIVVDGRGSDAFEVIDTLREEGHDVTCGRIVGCSKCGHIACVCQIRRDHVESCRFRISATCAVGIECEHGRDVCPTCDPCTCPP